MNRLLPALAAGLLLQGLGAQDDARARTERLLDIAREGAPTVRPQAARRLVGDPEAALPILLERSADPAALAALGPAVVEVLGELESAELRARLWRALADRDFPWRPAAARSLAVRADTGERDAWMALTSDPIAAVRAAALDGLVAVDAMDARGVLERALHDRHDAVRRRAAEHLVRRGERWALRWLLEDLKRDDQFFFQLDGRDARFQAHRLLERLGVDLHAYRPASAPDTEANARALAAIERDLTELLAHPKVDFPEHARAAGALPTPPVLGLELRSCREGELFLRFTADDVLWVGVGRAHALTLPPGTSAALLAVAERELGALGAQRVFGEPGCDLEQLYWNAPDRVHAFRVSKGYEPVEGLRPAPLVALLRALVRAVPAGEDAEDPEVRGLRDRVLRTLHAIGGPLGD